METLGPDEVELLLVTTNLPSIYDIVVGNEPCFPAHMCYFSIVYTIMQDGNTPKYIVIVIACRHDQ